jgi:signal transduction histidine kinase
MAESVALRTSELEFSRKQLAKWNLDLEDKIQQRTKELSALNTVITTVSQSLDQDHILKEAIKKILAVMEIEAGFVYLLDDKTGQLITDIQKGLSPKHIIEDIRFEPGESLFKKIVQSKEPLVINDIAENSEFGSIIEKKITIRSSVSVPIRSHNEILGVMCLSSHVPERFSYEMIPLISAMGDAIGVAINNARAAGSLRDSKEIRDHLLEELISAQEDERRRIARELHDEASQFLAALTLNLESITGVLPQKYKDVKTKLDDLKKKAIETIGSIRTLALELRPSVLDDLGLSKAVQWYAKDYLTKQGLTVNIEIAESKTKIPTYTETMLFRIIQEALTNIVKHAEASHVEVELQLVGSAGIIRIDDNGKGFDVKSSLTGETSWQNLGLHGMSERVTLLGGKFTINSTVGQGTIIDIEVPLGGIKSEKH